MNEKILDVYERNSPGKEDFKVKYRKKKEES